MELIPLYIYGAGGAASYVKWTVEMINDVKPTYELLGLIDDRSEFHGKIEYDLPIVSLDEAGKRAPRADLVAAVGSTYLRQKLVKKAKTYGFKFPTLVDPNSRISKSVRIGEGTIIVLHEIVGPECNIGEHVHLTGGFGVIGHHVTIQDYCTIASGVNIAGHVRVGKNVFIGAGATIIDGTSKNPLIIADDVFIGAGSLVNKSITQNGIRVAGVPARQIP